MEKGTFSITKSTVESYKIRHTTGMYWADITIDSNDNSGRIQIASDYGDYQYYWGSCGMDFKSFLAKLDLHYTAGKFGENRWFDFDATIKGIKEHIKECGLSKTENEVIQDEIKYLEENCADNENEFVLLFFQQKELSEHFDYPDIVKGITPQFRKFWTHVWPVLLAEFEKERVPS